jgi:DDE superfamily endonuclease/Tc5 transposase DNA-binding domain/Fission yeast centromere protein N-terminal domain
MDTPPTLKRRRALTDLDRREIRKYNSEHPITQQGLVTWYYQKTGFRLNQSQISRILSPHYDYLDGKRSKLQLTSKRHGTADYPDVEFVLFEWQQFIQRKKGVITGDILQAKASEIFKRLPQFQNTPEPKWSNGWLDGFKKRFKIKEYVRHGEASSAAVNDPEMIAKMTKLRKLCAQYHPRDIFNMDETGLYWKRVPDRSLATESIKGVKKAKDRITIALTANADGSEKLEPWVIGKSKNPRCLARVNRRLLGIEYRYNNTKWMNSVICDEFLRWFDQLMRGRKVLLLMDNFSAHTLGKFIL